jgi:hypothetical protein
MYICSLERVNTLLQEHMIMLIWRNQTEVMTCLMHRQWARVNMNLKYMCFYYFVIKPNRCTVYKPVWHIPLLSVKWINSWWWRDELSETCRVSWQNKFVKLVHLFGFNTKKFVTMHGHMNVKKSAVITYVLEQVILPSPIKPRLHWQL